MHPAHRALLALLVFSVLGCEGPTGFFPGGALAGEVAPTPSGWASVGEWGTAQLETNPTEPYSINLAYTVLDGTLSVNAGDTETQWVQHMSADPRVRLRIDGTLYELRAERVIDAEEIARFGEAWTSQSRFRRDPSELDPVWVYRLVAR